MQLLRGRTVIIAAILLAIPLILIATIPVHAQEPPSLPTEAHAHSSPPANDLLPVGMGFLAAAVAVGLGSIGAGIAVGATASAAVGAVAERDEVAGKALVFVGLAEGIAIYGLVVAIMILNKL